MTRWWFIMVSITLPSGNSRHSYGTLPYSFVNHEFSHENAGSMWILTHSYAKLPEGTPKFHGKHVKPTAFAHFHGLSLGLARLAPPPAAPSPNTTRHRRNAPPSAVVPRAPLRESGARSSWRPMESMDDPWEIFENWYGNTIYGKIYSDFFYDLKWLIRILIIVTLWWC